MDDILQTIGTLAKEAGPKGAFFGVGCLAILGLAKLCLDAK